MRLTIFSRVLFLLTFCASLGANGDEVTLSKPEVAANDTAAQGSPSSPKPSQGEGEKAPAQSRPTVVPEFSLPEVVITGENELTIGAQRLDRKENDVTLGSHELTGLDRAFNDLPGLDKTLTALSTEDAGPTRDTALILHLGGGIPNTYGGWGLFGQKFKDAQYLLSGHYSNWGGESTASGFDGDRKYGFGLETKLFSAEPLSFLLSGNFRQTDAELPYQSSMRELHQGLQINGTAYWKLSELVQSEFKVSSQSTWLNFWDQSSKTNQTQELEGQFKLTAEDLGSFLNRLSIEAGGRHATSDFSGSQASAYDWAWAGLQAYFKHGENLGLTAKLQGQGGSGLNLPAKFYPVIDLTWMVFENSQLDLYWRNDRYVDNFQNTFQDVEHISPEAGFPAPTELNGEWGARFTQKLSEKIIASLSASTAQYLNYHQWSDINFTTPSFIQSYSTLGQVQINKAAANLQWSLTKDWIVAATYEWTQGLNQSDGRNLTALPTHRGILSLYRSENKLETRIELQGLSERQAFESAPGILPAMVVLNLDATYH
ncbi:MAG TPA: hypothetical protein VIJ93_13915, partial [bacterium]